MKYVDFPLGHLYIGILITHCPYQKTLILSRPDSTPCDYSSPAQRVLAANMKSKLLFDLLKRRMVADAEIKRMALRYITHTESLPSKTRMLAQFKLAEMPAKTAINRIVRRCTITARVRSVLAEFNINRMKFREMALKGQLLGVQKSSW